ncbi:hypothetical protein TSUD_404040 [Trifolium subterraneum]|uniref:Cytochrome P450 n=1 Tax=Trifolium subterraneum TaxID=3900 RepID=A0A2Z6PDU1_TRISU|nr:hypothetical protein TSUD_404040 [Trifolium subterraneum]
MFLVTTLFIKYYCCTQKSEKPKLPPGPTPWPIVGNLPEMLANRPTFRWIQKLMNDVNTQILCIRLGNVHVITVSDPEISREICIKQDANFASRPSSWSNEFVTTGYLTTTLTPSGEQWKKIKKLISNELVSPLRHQWLHDKRVEEADNIVRYVYTQCTKIGGDGIVNVSVAAQHYTGNVIRRLLLNTRYFGNGSEDFGPGFEEVEYVEAVFTVLQYLFAFSISDFMPCLRGLDLDGHEINQPELLKKAVEELDSVVGKERLVQEYDFPKLNFVKACAREAFRRHPICDFNLPHVAMKDTVVANYFIPKEPSLDLVTFGTGRRGCSGIMLGSSMTIMLFARLLHGFTWSVPPNQSSIDLSESHGGTTKAKPLVAMAKPRLPIEAYRLY